MTEEVARAMWQKSVEIDPDRQTLLAVEGGKVVGVARIGSDPNNADNGHLFSLYVHPEFAGKGIGSSLLDRALKNLVERGFSRQTLWVFKDNEVASKLYKSRGFSNTGAEKIDPRWQIPEVELISKLEP